MTPDTMTRLAEKIVGMFRSPANTLQQHEETRIVESLLREAMDNLELETYRKAEATWRIVLNEAYTRAAEVVRNYYLVYQDAIGEHTTCISDTKENIAAAIEKLKLSI